MFPFMELATELRDMVYHELWLDTPSFVVKYSPPKYNGVYTSFKVSYLGSPEAIEANPAVFDLDDQEDGTPVYMERKKCAKELLPDWLRLNKTILEEVLALYRRNASWSWGTLNSTDLDPYYSIHGYWNDDYHGEFYPGPGIVAPLLLPIFTKEMKVFLWAEENLGCIDSSARTRAMNLPHDSLGDHLGLLTHALVETSAKLRSLKVYLSMADVPSAAVFHHPEEDCLRCVERLSPSIKLSLERLEFNFCIALGDVRLLSASLKEMVTERVHDVACALVGKQVPKEQPEVVVPAQFNDMWPGNSISRAIWTYKYKKMGTTTT